MKKIKIAQAQLTMAAMQIQQKLNMTPAETEIAMTAALAEVRSFALHELYDRMKEGNENERVNSELEPNA